MARETKSPLKAKALRNPGQSAEEQLYDVMFDRVLQPALLAVMLMMLAGIEWARLYLPAMPNPLLYTVLAVLALGYAALRIVRARPAIKALQLGRDGERAVGQYLEGLRAKGYQVFHDVLGDGFNVDHVLIGPGGVFTVETRTFSKPVKGAPKILFDGDTLRVDGFEPDRNPIVQAKAQARWLRKLIAESTGRLMAVQAMVLFPGWFIERSKGAGRDVWVLEPKALPSFLDKERPVLEEEDVHLAAFHLSRFIRNRGGLTGT